MRVEYREEPCRSALNRVRGMPFRWSLNPYTGCVHRCTFCYVRHFEQRADRPSDNRYGRTIRVKTNIVAVLRDELSRRSWQREEVAIGAATDPYQPCEGRYRLTRACLVELAAARTPVGLITRGPLVWRDVDVLQDAARAGGVFVSVSIPTLDDRVWRTTEPGTAPPHSRMEIVRRLAEAGVKVGVAVAPVLPGISDEPEALVTVVRAAREAGAHSIWCAVVHLRPGTKEHFLDALARDWPEQLERYTGLYARSAYPPPSLVDPIKATVREAAAATARPRRPVIRPAPQPEQLTLSV
ncbi:MAG: radical SAM protein [Gaiellales bacterium]